MTSMSFLMTGESAPFRPADTCPVVKGPHGHAPEKESFMVADAATADQSAAVRLVLWRCQFCGVLIAGVGHAGVPVDRPGHGIHSQAFTWLEESVALLSEEEDKDDYPDAQ